jgi:hypothetical protein
MKKTINKALNLIATEIIGKTLDNQEKKSLVGYLRMYAEAIENSIDVYEPTATMKKMNNDIIKYETEAYLGTFFVTGRWTNRFAMIPIEHLDKPAVREFIRENKCRIRYRGPRRRVAPELEGKGLGYWGGNLTYAGKSDCLKKDATHFTLYPNARS